MPTATGEVGLKGDVLKVKVTVTRCDSCGRLLDDEKDIKHVEELEFCASCLSEVKREVETYLKNMSVGADNDKCAAFIIHAHSVMVGHAIGAVRAEEVAKNDQSGFQK